MVVKALVSAKIDRPAGIIRFGDVQQPEQVKMLSTCSDMLFAAVHCSLRMIVVARPASFYVQHQTEGIARGCRC